MPMKLNPFSNPQLDDLPETVSRQDVLASAKRRKPFSFLLPYVLLVSFGLTMFPLVMLIVDGPLVDALGWRFITMMFLMVFLAQWPLALVIYTIRAGNQKIIRSIMRQYYQVPICVRCGYQAASMETQTCPECGKPVDGKKKAN